MFLFPFRNLVLKTNLTREEVCHALLDATWLSDEGYKKQGDGKKFFFGTVSREDFSLESIHHTEKLVPWIEGSIRGVENEMYIFLSLKGFRYKRVYFLFLLFLLTGISIVMSDFLEFGFLVWSQTGTLIFSLLLLGLLGYLVYSWIWFSGRVQTATNFFRGMLQADQVKRSEVPVVFRL